MATLSDTARNGGVAGVVGVLDGGSGPGLLVFRTAGDVPVATLTFSDPAFGSPVGGVATANAIAQDNAAAGGDIAKATMQDSDANIHITSIVAVSGAEFTAVGGVTVAPGTPVVVTSLTVTMPAS